MFADVEVSNCHPVPSAVYQNVGVTEAVGVEYLEAVIAASGDVPRSGVAPEAGGGTCNRLLGVGEVEHRAGRRFDLEP